MAHEASEKLAQDLLKIRDFLQAYLIQISNRAQLFNESFSDKLTRTLIPYAELQLQFMHDDIDENNNPALIAQSLYGLLTDAPAIRDNAPFQDELTILHQLLHVPAKVLNQYAPGSVHVNNYDMTPLIGTITKINLLRYLCTHFEALNTYRQQHQGTIDANYPLVQHINEQWLASQFDAIKKVAANPHQHVRHVIYEAAAPISAIAFPQVGGVDIQIQWQAGAEPANRAPSPPASPPASPVRLVIQPPVFVPNPPNRPYNYDYHRQYNYDYNHADNYNPPNNYLAQYNAINRRKRIKAFATTIILAIGLCAGIYYRAALMNALSSLASMLLLAPITIAKTAFALSQGIATSSFALSQSIATSSFAFLTTASPLVLIGISVIAFAMIIKAAKLANRSHAQGFETVSVDPVLSQRLNEYLNHNVDRLNENQINPRTAVRFSSQRREQDEHYQAHSQRRRAHHRHRV